MNGQAVVSIIIPVHNVGAYLRACLDSVAAQTYTAWEAICVDDGSTDESPDILREYAAKDARFRIIWQENRGAGISRNVGMQAARGKYLYFIDSDDFLMPRTLEVSVAACEAEQAQIALFSFYRVNAQTGKIISRGRAKTEFLRHRTAGGLYLFKPSEVAEHLFQISRIAPWNRLLNREFVIRTGILFEDRPNSNDLFFTHMTLVQAERVVAVDIPLYNYRISVKNSLQSGKHADPCQFIEARLSTRTALMECGFLPLYEKTWQTDFLNGCSFSVMTTRGRAALRQIYQRLLRPDIAGTGVFSQKLPPVLENFLKGPDLFSPAEDRSPKKLRVCSVSSTPAVSVIVPVFGAAGEPQSCVRSLLGQTLASMEIICVCDGAEERTVAPLLALAEEDARITVITESRSGSGAARNTALRYATGKYVYFYEIGTQPEASALEALYRCAEDAGTDILFFESDRSAKYARTGPFVGNGRDFFLQTFETGKYDPSVCLQFLKREFLSEHGIAFEEGILSADEAFTFRALLCAEKVSVLKGELLRGSAAFSESSEMSGLFRTFSSLTTCCACIREAARCETEPAIKASFEKKTGALRKQFLHLYKGLDADSITLLKAYCDAEQSAVLDEADQSLARRSQSSAVRRWQRFLRFRRGHSFRITVNRIVAAVTSGIKTFFRK